MHSLFEQIANAVRPPQPTLKDVIAWMEGEIEFLKETDNYTPSDNERGYCQALKEAKKRLEALL